MDCMDSNPIVDNPSTRATDNEGSSARLESFVFKPHSQEDVTTSMQHFLDMMYLYVSCYSGADQP